jgi:hypothetical protein
MISFDKENSTSLDYEETERIAYNTKDNFFERYIFYNNKLYSFVFNEFSDFSTYARMRFSDGIYKLDNPDICTQEFERAVGLENWISYHQEDKVILLTQQFKEEGWLVGMLKNIELMNSEFDEPLSIDNSQYIFGLPDYYIVEKNKRGNTKYKTVLTVYEFAHKQVIFIFYEGYLVGSCLI